MFKRMPFGVKQAPEWLQYTMDDVLDRVPGKPAKSFYDDVQVPGTCWVRNWEDVRGTLRALTQAGFMINLRKCQFLQPRVVMVGLEVHRGSYRLAQKSLKRWIGAALPRSLQELQSVLGRLLWASPFIPNYKQKVRPIEALLSPNGPGEWTSECTAALNALLRDVERRLAMAIAKPMEPVQVHVSMGPESGMVALSQQ
jgi:hypothetical protein